MRTPLFQKYGALMLIISTIAVSDKLRAQHEFDEDIIITNTTATVTGFGPVLVGATNGLSASDAFFIGGNNGNFSIERATDSNAFFLFTPASAGNRGAWAMRNGSSIYLWGTNSALASTYQGVRLDGSHVSGKFIKLYATSSSNPDVTLDKTNFIAHTDFSGDGTNNVMANQILLSDDSIMTRGLADARFNSIFTNIIRISTSDDLYSTLNDNIADSTWFQIAPGTYNLTNTFSVNNGNDYVRISGAGYELTSITNNRIKIDAYGSYFDNFHAIGDDWFTFGNDSWALETTMESVKVTGNGAFATDRSGVMQFNLIDCVISGTNPLNLSSDGGNFALLANTDVNGVVYNGEYTDFQAGTSSGALTNNYEGSTLLLDLTRAQPNGDLSMGDFTN